MKQHIAQFPQYLIAGYEIGQEVEYQITADNFSHILFLGMGGSGMTSTIIARMIEYGPLAVPCSVIKDYDIPGRVNEKTLMIVASYSGNTEETITAMKKGRAAGAYMIAITSGGQIYDFATEHDAPIAIIPTGIEPRAALPYAFGIQLALFEQAGYIDESVKDALDRCSTRSLDAHEMIHEEAKHIAESIADSIPAIYSTPAFTSLALRLRQQLNENSRMLCRDHTIPEHNHNELLGRQEGDNRVQVIFLTDPTMGRKNAKRYELTKHVLSERNVPYHEITYAGSTYLEKIISTIYRIDRLSYYTAMRRGVDPNGMALIEWLKGELASFR